MVFIDWSDQENQIIVADYFAMLVDELKGLKINKTHHRKAIMPMLNNRPDGSVEFKHQNISAVLAEMGLPSRRFKCPTLTQTPVSVPLAYSNDSMVFSDFVKWLM